MTEFQKLLEAEIKATEAEIAKLVNTANVTRSFSEGVEFHRLLNLQTQKSITLKAALEAYKKSEALVSRKGK